MVITYSLVSREMELLEIPCGVNFVKCGNVNIVEMSSMLQKNRHNAFIRCTKNDRMHILEIFPDSAMASPYGYINLRKCKISICNESTKQLAISKVTTSDTQNGFVFEVKNETEASEWRDVLSSSCVLKSSPDTSPLIHRSQRSGQSSLM